MFVFVSYSSKDRALAEILASDLIALGHEVWFDKELTGGHIWWDEIVRNIRECDLFIFALSPQSLNSYPCKLEYSYAHVLNKRILPVLIEDVNTSLLPAALSVLQFVDYRNRDNKQAVLSLHRALNSLPVQQPLPDPLPVPPGVPLSPLNKIRDSVDSPNLSFQEQLSLVFELKGLMDQGETTTEDARDLLKRLLDRQDLYAKIASEIKAMLASGEALLTEPKPGGFFGRSTRTITLLATAAVVGIIIIGLLLLSQRANTGQTTPPASFTSLSVAENEATTPPVKTQPPTSTSTAMPTLTATLTPTPSPTETASPTPTPTPSATNTSTETSSPTPTSTPSATNTPTATPTPNVILTQMAARNDRSIASITGQSWPTGGYNVARTRYNDAEHKLTPPLEQYWAISLDNYSADVLAVSQDKLAVAGMGPGQKNQVYMLDAFTGDPLWDYILPNGGGGAMSTTPIFGNGLVYFGGQGDSHLYALHVDNGQVAWEQSGFSGIYSSDIGFLDNVLYVPDDNRGVVMYDANTGDPISQRGTGAWGAPVTIQNNIVFAVKSNRSTLVALDGLNGLQELWSYSGLASYFTWVVADDNVVYSNVSDTEVAAFDLYTGDTRWTKRLDIEFVGDNGAALADNRLFVPVWKDKDQKGAVIALDALTGDVLWTYSTDGEGVIDVAVANNVVYALGWGAHSLLALDPENGDLLWSEPIFGTSLAIANGRLYVAGSNTIYAYGN